MPRLKIVLIVILISLLLLSQGFVRDVKSAVSSCSADVDNHNVQINSSPNLGFTVSNSSSVTISWVKITAPSTNFTVTGGSGSGFTASVTSSSVTFTGGTMSAGSSRSFFVNTTIGGTAAGAASWIVTTSDDSGGANPTTCSGNTSVTISSGPPDEETPRFSNITVTDVGSSSVKINWTTNEPATSTVNYGTVAYTYPSTKSDGALVTSHVLEITSLSANTTYHYEIRSADAVGNEAEFGDATFVTAKEGTTGATVTVTTTSTSTTTTSTAASPVPKVVPDTTAPSITITTDFSDPYTEAPTISGRATDNKGIEYIEYSLDNGKNWSPAEIEGSYGAVSVGFSFLPLGVTDGNYKIVVRARDTSKNTGVSRFYTLIIDRLPPQVGGGLISIGPQILTPNILGIVTTIQGLDQKITLSAVGGPTEIDLSTGNKQLFSLVKNPDNGLWSGTLSFQDPGRYSLTARSIDGAENITERTIGETIVVSRGRVTDGGQPVTTARLTVYWYDEMIKHYRIWDGAPFGQVNPQAVATDGSYGFLLPAGKYYIEVKAPGYKTVKSTIFELTESLPINTEFILAKRGAWQWGPFDLSIFDIPATKTETRVIYPEGIQDEDEESLVGEELPSFTLEVGGEPLSSFDLRGKEGVLTFLSSWSPQTSEQINHLADFKDQEKYTLLAIFEQDKSSVVETYKKRGNYDLPIIPDSDGVLVEPLKLHAFPTHIFINRKGIIKDIKVGVLTSEEIREGLQN